MRINTTNKGQIELFGHPNTCPFCFRSITPHIVSGHNELNKLGVFMWCPDISCKQSFIGYYEYIPVRGRWEYSGEYTKGNISTKKFSDSIVSISPTFTTIFNQAYFAEQNGLSEICGVGYRKALEFLIKDYAILKKPDEKEKIEKKLLGQCIDQFITDGRVKSVAKRAAWLGNDETHYVRKWEGKNLEDLKKLIELTIHWIEMEVLTNSFEEEMPE